MWFEIYFTVILNATGISISLCSNLLFYVCCVQGSLHVVSAKFLQQTLDKKLMSNMRVRIGRQKMTEIVTLFLAV